MPVNRTSPKRVGGKSLVTTSVAGDMLVYDLERQHMHHLNAVAASVWDLCDGQRSVPAIAAAATSELGEPVGVEAVRMALSLLESANLIEGGYRQDRGSRRSFVRKAAIGGALIPAIASTTAPAAAQNGSPTCDGVGDPVSLCNGQPDNRCCNAGANCLGFCSESAICNPRWGTGIACQPL